MTVLKRGVYHWKYVTTRPAHLTIEQVEEIPIGEVRYFAVFCRNLGDFLDHLQWDDEEQDWEARSIRFTPDTWPGYVMAYKKTGEGIRGKCQILCWSEGERFDEDEADHKWHINYKDESWYPLMVDNESLPNTDFQGFAHFGTGRHYKDFPKDTRLGWRGPVIPFEKLNDFILLS